MKPVWHWEDFASWRDDVLALMSDVLTPKVLHAFAADPPELATGDDLGWLDRIVLEQEGREVLTKHRLTQRLRGRYGSIRAYHGSRPADPMIVRAQGLRLLDPATRLEALASTLHDAGMSVDEGQLRAAAAQAGEDGRAGRVFFEANLAYLVRHCGHYMLYGSEYANAVALRISPARRAALAKVGVPTVFVCNVPLEFLEDGLLSGFAGTTLQSLLLTQVDPHHQHTSEVTASGMLIRVDLPPECIVDHFTPECLHDPYTKAVVRTKR